MMANIYRTFSSMKREKKDKQPKDRRKVQVPIAIERRVAVVPRNKTVAASDKQ